MRRTVPSVTFLLLACFTAAVLVFLLAPTILVSWASFGRAETLSVPPTTYSLHWYERLVQDWQWRSALANSVLVALLAGAISTFAGVTAAFGLLSVGRALRPALFAILLIPLVFPAVALGVGQLSTFASLRLPDSTLRLALSHLAICLPVAFLVIALSVFGPLQKHINRALSFTDSRTFVLSRVVVPLMGLQLAGAAIVSFLFSFDEPVLSQFVGGPNTDTVPRRVFASVRFELDPTAAAVTFIVFVVWMATVAVAIFSNRSLAANRQA